MVTVCVDPGTVGEKIVVWDLNGGTREKPIAVTMVHSVTKVLNMQVRYGMVDGQVSLVIAYARPPVQGYVHSHTQIHKLVSYLPW